jgi:hypothetical protein
MREGAMENNSLMGWSVSGSGGIGLLCVQLAS